MCRGEFFLKINKHADQNKTVQGEFFFSKLINVRARLFGTLEYFTQINDVLTVLSGVVTTDNGVIYR